MAETFEDYGLQLNAVPSFERLRYESPINISNNNQFSGECFVGAFSYFNPHGEFAHVTFGRYCSVSQWVCVGPGRHQTHTLTTHPFFGDPLDTTAQLGNFESYRSILGTREYSPPARAAAPLEVKIGHDVWIGMRAIIMSGLTIGDGAIIAAGAVVTKDVAPYSIVAGVPAHEVRKRFAPAIIEKLLELRWWDYDMAHVINQVDFGKIEEVIAFMDERIKGGHLPRFSTPTFEAKRRGAHIKITQLQPGVPTC